MGIPARRSAVTIKRPEETASMRRAGAILVEVLEGLERELRPGITTAALDRIAEEIIIDAGAVPSFKGYGTNPPFPASICASVNDEVVHGIPSPRRLLNEGDIVGIDVGCIWQGGHAGWRPLVAPGIGRAMHEAPNGPNYGRAGTGMRIEAGMCFAIEPMFNIGGDGVYLLDDDWTVATADRSLSAHFENTIAVADGGPQVLTSR